MDRLRQRADFLAVANGARIAAVAFVVQSRHRDDGGPIRVGFTVTKKNGTATERNRIRRRLRELVKRLDAISMRPHSDYVLVGRRAALTCDFSGMLEDLHSALHRMERQPSRPRDAKASSGEVGVLRVGKTGKRAKAKQTVDSALRRDRVTTKMNDEI